MRKFNRDDENRILPDEPAPKEWVEKALRRPSDFGYFGEGDGMFETWALGPVVETRDSTILEKANRQALEIFLKSDLSLKEDWRITSCSHWAVGWVEHLSFRAVEADGTPTRIAGILHEWFEYLRNEYPVANDDLYSEMEWEATHRWLAEEGPRQARRQGYQLPEDDWLDQLKEWWDLHDSSALDSIDDNGASPSDEQWAAAFEGCGFRKED